MDNELIMEIVRSYLIPAIVTLLAAFFGYIGTQIKKIYKEFVNTETKEKVVKTVVKAVEQIYKDLNGPERYDKAKENIVLMLNEKGLSITEIEMNMLIEACVSEFNLQFKGNALIELEEEVTNE